ncbi:cytosolic 5'-nucleotidase 1B [Antennarius striatus]|uniref:cytosolic 5'-nucleotidase 1B n=1 Tax=Antennarius striatus TaxID=241820 RepID=UPI0035B37C80
MVSTIPNPHVKQKVAERALVVAVTSRSVFDSGADDGGVLGVGVAFPLLQALQRVNERLLEDDPAETLLFDVVLITTDAQQQQQRPPLLSSARHHGLDVSRFCFSGEDDFLESLLTNDVQLFLTTDQRQAQQASGKGVLSALMDQQVASSPSEQLRVMFCGDAVVRSNSDLMGAIRPATQRFLARLGELRRRFGVFHSPLSIILVTFHGGRDSCGGALRTLRSRGVHVDEVYCLAGAPRGPIMSQLRPHFLLREGLSGLQE